MSAQNFYSVIVPVYNRIDEVRDLLDSLAAQTDRNFEVVIVEDGSTQPCQAEVRRAVEAGVDAHYYYKENEGRSIARNHGMERARGNYFLFFDSDCVIPPDYFAKLNRSFAAKGTPDCFGGPDAAHESFSTTQKAINYTMTSFLTTGGIRGGKVSMEKFTPRTFNMGFSRQVYDKVGGFREMFSEDIDMSTRIKQAGFGVVLVPDAYVWHKRRVDWRRFWRQVHVFGMSRITLKLLYPGSLKLVHCLPAFAVIIAALLVLGAIFWTPWCLLPLALYAVAIVVASLVATKSVTIAAKSLPAAFIQIVGYGTGFIKAYFTKILLGRGRDVEAEIAMRKGK